MRQPSLPTLKSESWDGGVVPETSASAQAVSASRGVILAGGTGLTLLRAGETTLKARVAPAAIGPVRSVAVEPRRQPRLAVCGTAGIALLDGTRVGTLGSAEDSPPEAVAWGTGPGGRSWLYFSDEIGQLRRMRPETGDVEEIPIDGVVALASDESGTIAVATMDPDSPRIWTTHDGADWQWRVIPELGSIGPWNLAVAGDAAAVAIERGVWVSRNRGEGFSKCEALGEGGALTFEGATSDAAILGAVHVEYAETIVRVDAEGAATTVVQIDSDVEEPYLSALAWDGARRTLWGGLPGAGLIRLDAPDLGGKPRAMLS